MPWDPAAFAAMSKVNQPPVLSDAVLRNLVERLEQLQKQSSTPDEVQESIDDVRMTLKLRSVTGRAVHTIDHKLVRAQRAISAMTPLQSLQKKTADEEAAPQEAAGKPAEAPWVSAARAAKATPR